MLIRKFECHNCGAAASKEIESSFIYCDACGSFVDTDYSYMNSACLKHARDPKIIEFNKFTYALQDKLTEAIKAKDRDDYIELRKEWWQNNLDACPWNASIKVSDPEYRKKWVEFYATCEADAWVAPEYEAINKEYAAITAGIQWDVDDSKYTAKWASFKSLVDMHIRYNRFGCKFIDAKGYAALNPEPMPENLEIKWVLSGFIQGWKATLSPENIERAVKEYNLVTSFQYIPDSNGEKICGGCGNSLEVSGSCSACGKTIETNGKEIKCSGCSAPIVIAVDSARINCPYCSTVISKV